MVPLLAGRDQSETTMKSTCMVANDSLPTRYAGGTIQSLDMNRLGRVGSVGHSKGILFNLSEYPCTRPANYVTAPAQP